MARHLNFIMGMYCISPIRVGHMTARVKNIGKSGRENSLWLDFDPKSFIPHRQYIHWIYTLKCRKTCWLSADGLISDVGLTVLTFEAPERQTQFSAFFTYLSSFSPLTEQLFSLFRYSSFWPFTPSNIQLHVQLSKCSAF